MKIHIPEFKAMAVCNEHLNHGPIDIDLGPDVVKVVRCRYCQYLVGVNKDGKGFPTCSLTGRAVAHDEYCSRGKKGQ